MSRISASAQGHLAMLCFSALVAGSFSLGAQVANEITPTALNAVRIACRCSLALAAMIAELGRMALDALRSAYHCEPRARLSRVFFHVKSSILKLS